MIKKLLLIPAVMAFVMVGTTATASAQVVPEPDNEDKVTICHATNSVNNPYVQIEVDEDAVNDGDPNDHAGHTGPVPTSEAEAQAMKDAKTDWGDIIPPFEGFAGLNWTADGQAIYNNDCEFVEPTTTPGEPGRGGDTPTVVTTSTPQVDAPKAVRAGNGAVAGVAALLTVSVASITLGVRRLLASR